MPQVDCIGLTREQEQSIYDLENALDKCREKGLNIRILFYGLLETEENTQKVG